MEADHRIPRVIRAKETAKAGSRSPAARFFAALALGAGCFLAACAKPPAPEQVSPGSLTVRIGPIDPVALETAVKSAPKTLPLRSEQLVDLLWQSGCMGAVVETPLASASQSPDVICSLPGRTEHRILVLAHLDGDEKEHGAPWHWSGVALLPILYRSLAVEPREHTFTWIAFGRSPQPTARDVLMRLGSPLGDDVRAIIDLQEIEPPSIWFSSSDAGLRRDLVAASLALGRPLESLRSFAPIHGDARAGVPMLVIAAAPPSHGSQKAPAGKAPAGKATPVSPATNLHAGARLVAAYLAYLDETLRLRAESAPHAPAEPSAPADPGAH